MRGSVYLAGPISGLSYNGCTDWRERAKAQFASVGIDAFSPMRAKLYLSDHKNLSPTCADYGDNPMSTPRGITARDRFDATNCDVLLVNLLGATRVSIGTMFEMAWADSCRIPIVCAIEPEGNVHEHGMLQDLISFRVTSIEEAVKVAAAVILP